MRHRILFMWSLLTTVFLVEASGQSGAGLIQEWAEGWRDVPGSRWVWEFRLPGPGEPEVSEDVSLYGLEAFVRATTMELVVGRGPTTDVSGFDEQGRFYSLSGHSNSYVGGGTKNRMGLFLASEYYAPCILAHLINAGVVQIEQDDLEIMPQSDLVVWTPDLFGASPRYTFGVRYDVPALLRIERLDSEEEPSIVLDYEYAPDRVVNGVAVPRGADSTTYLKSFGNFKAEMSPDGSGRPVGTTRRNDLVSFQQLDETQKPVVDPEGRTRFVSSTGEILDPDGIVINKVTPMKSTSGAFRWSSVVLLASVAIGATGGAIWLYRRLR